MRVTFCAKKSAATSRRRGSLGLGKSAAAVDGTLGKVDPLQLGMRRVDVGGEGVPVLVLPAAEGTDEGDVLVEVAVAKVPRDAARPPLLEELGAQLANIASVGRHELPGAEELFHRIWKRTAKSQHRRPRHEEEGDESASAIGEYNIRSDHKSL